MDEEPRFLNIQDVEMRLSRGIVKWNNKYVFAETEGAYLFVYDIPFSTVTLWQKSKQRIDYNDVNLDVRSLEVGYVNFDTKAIFVTRPPCRKQKQAISSENLVYYENGKTGKKGGTKVSDDIVLSPHFHKMLINDYPSFEKALEIVDELASERSQAFSKAFALVKPGVQKINLEMHNNKIGEYDRSTKSIRLDSLFQTSFITMKLLELGVPVNG